MRLFARDLLDIEGVRAGLRKAWSESKPGDEAGHEEGGFIIRVRSNSASIIRWPKGLQDQIVVPEHAGCGIDGRSILATFHTHPNVGPDYIQEPSETDISAVRDDPDLKGPNYVGEFV